MIRLYGVSGSRALRSLWLLEELGIEYEHVPVPFTGNATREADFLAINPNGHIPALVDGELVLFESMAINLYLAERYGASAGFWPGDPDDRARAVQWSFWAMTEAEPPLVDGIAHRFLLPEARRRPEVLERAQQRLAGPLAVLDAQLRGHSSLVGDHFGVADLNVAAVLGWMPLLGFATDGFPVVKRWLEACWARPAYARARALP